MGMKEWYMARTVKKMSPAEKQGMMNTMMDKFFESLSAEEKRELMNAMMPKMMDRMFEGMTAEDRLGLMGTMMPKMMAQMFGGEEGAPGGQFRMPACGGGAGTDGAGPEHSGDFKPWEMCPCRNFCESGKKAGEAIPQPARPDR